MDTLGGFILQNFEIIKFAFGCKGNIFIGWSHNLSIVDYFHIYQNITLPQNQAFSQSIIDSTPLVRGFLWHMILGFFWGEGGYKCEKALTGVVNFSLICFLFFLRPFFPFPFPFLSSFFLIFPFVFSFFLFFLFLLLSSVSPLSLHLAILCAFSYPRH